MNEFLTICLIGLFGFLYDDIDTSIRNIITPIQKLNKWVKYVIEYGVSFFYWTPVCLILGVVHGFSNLSYLIIGKIILLLIICSIAFCAGIALISFAVVKRKKQLPPKFELDLEETRLLRNLLFDDIEKIENSEYLNNVLGCYLPHRKTLLIRLEEFLRGDENA